MAKNKMRRCLRATLDPHPSEADVDALWKHFGSICAYCGVALERSSRQGHEDHAVPTAVGGTNSIHSHALSCAHCNGDKKREESWESFLRKECSSPEELESRRRLIDDWIFHQSQVYPSAASELEARANTIIEEALVSFDRSVAEMRRLRRGA